MGGGGGLPANTADGGPNKGGGAETFLGGSRGGAAMTFSFLRI